MTKIWHFDDGAYRAAYYAAVAKAKTELPGPILAQISIPGAVALPHEYTQQSFKLLVVGQETFDDEAKSLQDADPYHSWAHEMGGNVAFDYAFGGDNQKSGPFWTAFEEVAQAFGKPTRRALGWSNILKVQLLEKNGGSYSVDQRGLPGGCIPILIWQRALFQAEMQFLAPQAILFLTGDRRWILKHMYDNVQVNPVADSGFDIVTIADLPIPIAQTYHPFARNPRISPPVKQARANAIYYLKQQLDG